MRSPFPVFSWPVLHWQQFIKLIYFTCQEFVVWAIKGQDASRIRVLHVLIRAHLLFAFFCDYDCDSSYCNEWVVQDSLEVFTLCNCVNITSFYTAHFKQKQIALTSRTVWTSPYKCMWGKRQNIRHIFSVFAVINRKTNLVRKYPLSGWYVE